MRRPVDTSRRYEKARPRHAVENRLGAAVGPYFPDRYLNLPTVDSVPRVLTRCPRRGLCPALPSPQPLCATFARPALSPATRRRLRRQNCPFGSAIHPIGPPFARRLRYYVGHPAQLITQHGVVAEAHLRELEVLVTSAVDGALGMPKPPQGRHEVLRTTPSRVPSGARYAR